jgi:type VI secretion system protein ImpA
MSLVEGLLNPVKPDAPAGQNLRYDPVYDQIAEARSEEDATLPVGQWARPSKRADYQLVSFLTREALAKRSKDLWIAAWLGEARIQLDGLSALSPVFDLLLRLQEHFWDSLYPEIEDGDAGMRTAPLQWAMDCYAGLVYGLPAAAESVNYRDYKAARTSSSGVTTAQSVVEALEAALKDSSKAFYVSAESQLAEARDSLERLYLFCDEKYRDDGVSFVKVRTAIDEVYNLVASLLRAKRELDPDPVEPPPAVPEPINPGPAVTVAEAQRTLAMAATIAPEQVAQFDVPSPMPAEQSLPPKQEGYPEAELQSWEQALERIRQMVAYLSKQRPESPVPYLLLGAMHGGNRRLDGTFQQPPSTELRMMLKRAGGEGNGQLLLDESLRAMGLPFGGSWLDLHLYVWVASREVGYQTIAESVLDVVRGMLRQDTSLIESLFDDDTPKASQETKEWIETEVVPADQIAPAAQRIAVPEMPASFQPPTQEGEETLAHEGRDLFVEAEAVAAGGNLVGSIELLMQDATASAARRNSFQRRQQVARLCLARGQKIVARRLLEQLLAEVDEYRLELWEGPHLVGEVITMLLQSLDEKEEEQTALLARLCRIDPARALNLNTHA